jgi:Arc/MetJ-type ribon-helix-helix transcriptional regulator
LLSYLDGYQQVHHIRSRSEALEQAIRALQELQLKEEYIGAMAEWDASGENSVWDKTAGDGLEPRLEASREAW